MAKVAVPATHYKERMTQAAMQTGDLTKRTQRRLPS